jgi:hypothetical protein
MWENSATLSVSVGQDDPFGIIMPLPINNPHLPPHLRELCNLLARGLLRLRSRVAEDLARDAKEAGGLGDIRLHSSARQRRHANPAREGDA